MSKSILPVSCDTLGDMDSGVARLIIDAAIRDAVNDLEDRGAQDGKVRKVNIVISFDLMDNGLVDARVEATAKLPARRTASTIGEVTQHGRGMSVSFRKYSPEDPRQSTLLDDSDRDVKSHESFNGENNAI